MTSNGEQLELIGTKAEPISVELQDEIARRCRTRHAAIVETWKASGLEAKQVYGPLGVDQGQFSKIINGQKYLPPEMYHDYQRLCGNWILLRYDALHASFELKALETDAEARIKQLESELADRDRAIKYLGE